MKIIVQNLITEYYDEGSGPAILFLHGWQDNLHTFDALAPQLALLHRIIRLDLPGFGASEMPREAWNLDRYVLFVKDFVNKMDIRIAALVGHSFGGRIIIKGIATKNLQADKIVLISSAGISDSHLFRNPVLKILIKFVGLALHIPPLSFWRTKLRARAYGRMDSDYLKTGPLKETFVRIIDEDLSLVAVNVSVPALLIWGCDDTETPLADGVRLSRMIPDATFKTINGAGHFVHQEKPNEVAKLISVFL